MDMLKEICDPQTQQLCELPNPIFQPKKNNNAEMNQMFLNN